MFNDHIKYLVSVSTKIHVLERIKMLSFSIFVKLMSLYIQTQTKARFNENKSITLSDITQGFYSQRL